MNNERNRLQVRMVALIMCMVAVLALTACGSNSPKAKVTEEIKALKTSEISDDTLTDANIDLNDKTLAKYTEFMEKVQDFDYDITKVKESGDTAKVTVKVTTYSFGNEYLDFYEKFLEKNTDTESISQNKLYSRMFDSMIALDDKDYTTTVVINCEKDNDGEWSSDLSSNSDFQNAIFGDMIDVMKDIAGEDD